MQKKTTFRIRHLALTFILAATFFITGCTTAYKARKRSRERFINHSILVQNAKKSYQIGHNLSDGTPVTWDDLQTCLPAHWKPVCMSGGHLEPGKIGEPMKCSFHGQIENPRTPHPNVYRLF